MTKQLEKLGIPDTPEVHNFLDELIESANNLRWSARQLLRNWEDIQGAKKKHPHLRIINNL